MNVQGIRARAVSDMKRQGREYLMEAKAGSSMNSRTETGAILQLLKLTGVGPAEEFELEPAPRLNIITGDNGLGKTFLLDCAWWALTGTWAGAYPAYPKQDAPDDLPSITFQISKQPQPDKIQRVKYNWLGQAWTPYPRPDVLPGLAIYSQADGSFTVWDPAKRLFLEENPYENAVKASRAIMRFTRSEVWNGIEERDANGQVVRVPCNGLVRDWVYWQNANKPLFHTFSAVLEALSENETELLIPGEPTRLAVDDARDIPTLKFSYGEVPITLCSAGVQRIVAFAYLLVWAWHEHLTTSKLIRREPLPSIVLLVDEVEAHLHPFWQRIIIPALMNVGQKLASEAQTQLLIATHSPLVLASVETLFDDEQDKLFHLYLENGLVKLDDIPFVKRGRIDRWLTSDVFGLTQARSKDAEEAIEEAKYLQQKREPTTEEVKAVSDKLVKALAQDDDFWHRWTYFAEQRGVVL